MTQTSEIDTPPSATQQPEPLLGVARIWWAALIIGVISTLVVLFDGRIPMSVVFDDSSSPGPGSVTFTALVALVAGAATVGYWALEAISIRRLGRGITQGRVVLSLLGLVSVTIDALLLGLAGLAVAEIVLVALHAAAVVAAFAGSWLPATSARLSYEEPTAPDLAAPAERTGRPARIAAVCALVVVVAGASFVGSARQSVDTTATLAAAQLGVQGAQADCGVVTGVVAFAGAAQAAPCTIDAGDMSFPGVLRNASDGKFALSVRNAISLSKMAQSINDAATKQGVDVIDTDCGQSKGDLAYAPPGTEIDCTSSIQGGQSARIVATVDDDQGHVTFRSS